MHKPFLYFIKEINFILIFFTKIVIEVHDYTLKLLQKIHEIIVIKYTRKFANEEIDYNWILLNQTTFLKKKHYVFPNIFYAIQN